MPYQRKPETYDAVQWTGDNTEEVIQFANMWQSCFPNQSATHNPETNQITTCPGNVMNVGDWIVSAGVWMGGGGTGTASEVVTDAVFQAKYAETT